MSTEQIQKGLYAVSSTLIAYGINRRLIDIALDQMNIDPADTTLDESTALISAICGGLVATIAEDVDIKEAATFAPLLGGVTLSVITTTLIMALAEEKRKKDDLDLSQFDVAVQRSTLWIGSVFFLVALGLNKMRVKHNIAQWNTPSNSAFAGVTYGLPRPVAGYYPRR